MSAYAWYRRRMNRVRVREDLKALNGGGGLGQIFWLAAHEPWRWRCAYLKKRGAIS